MRSLGEQLVKEMRDAVISRNNCTGPLAECNLGVSLVASNNVYNKVTVNGHDAIWFRNKYGECVIYYYRDINGQLIPKKCTKASTGSAVESDFSYSTSTAAYNYIPEWKFSIRDNVLAGPSSVQPMISVWLGATVNGIQRTWQHTVSSRVYE
jgi:hypothetical protein